MKIRNYALLLAVSVLTTVSCNIFKNFDVDVPKLIDDNEYVSTAKLFDLESNKNLSAGASGGLVLSCEAEEPVSKNVEITSGGTKIGDISIPVSDAPATVENAATSDGQIILIIDNPSPEQITLAGSVEASAATKALATVSFEVTVPGNAKQFKVLLKDYTSTAVEPVDAVATTGSDFKGVLGGTKFTQPIKVGLVAKQAGTKADIAPAATTATITVNAVAKFPFTIKKGTVIKITKSFTELGLDLSKYYVKATTYDVKASITSTMPFSITGEGNSPQGVAAVISTPIAAGTISSPSTTDVTIAITDNTKDHVVNEAKIGLFLTAAEDGAKISSDTGLSIYYDSVLFHKF